MNSRSVLRKTSFFLSFLLLFIALPGAAPFVFSAGETVGGGGNASFSTTREELCSLGLPVVEIDTADGDYITTRLQYKEATMRISLSREYAAFQNTYTDEDGGAVTVKGRGNSTWNKGYPDGSTGTSKGAFQTRKAPYTVKLEKKADLFGLGRSKSWTLLANYEDRTSLCNKIAYDLAGKMGMVYTKSVFVNLVLNGEYMGVYLFCQKINEDLIGDGVTDWEDIAEDAAAAVARAHGLDDEKRQRLEDSLKTNASWITGGKVGGYQISDYIDLSSYDPYTGYILEYDQFTNDRSFFRTAHKTAFKVRNLDSIKTNVDLYKHLTGFLAEFEEALFSPTFCNSQGKHYSEYLDIDSVVDFYLVFVVMMNFELGNNSNYMYLNREGKLVFGPVWDFDRTAGNRFLKKSRNFTVWNDSLACGNNRWYHQLYRDPWFNALVRERWGQISGPIAEIVPEIEYWKEILTPSEKLEYEKFGGDPYEKDFVSHTEGRTFANEATDLARLMTIRIRWIDAQMNLRDPGLEDNNAKDKGRYEADGSFKLTAKGESSALSLASSGAMPYPAADGISAEFQDVTVETTLKRGDNLTVLANGKVLFSGKVTDAKGKVSVTVPAETFDPGINVIAFFRNAGEKNKKSTYFSLLMPGERRTAAGEQDLPWETAPAETEPPLPSETEPLTGPAEETPETDGGRGPRVLLLVALTVPLAAGGAAFGTWIGRRIREKKE